MWETGHLAITIIDMIFILALLTFFYVIYMSKVKKRMRKCAVMGVEGIMPSAKLANKFALCTRFFVYLQQILVNGLRFVANVAFGEEIISCMADFPLRRHFDRIYNK